MSINTKSKAQWLARHKKSIITKSVILFLATFLSGSVPWLTLYLGFWFGWWSRGIRIKVERKTSQNGVKTTDTSVEVELEH